jgi:serine protease Do
MAVGNPGVEGSAPLDYTVTSGIVSAKGRPLGVIRRSLDDGSEPGDALSGYAVENFIQTDAVINPGNSGGPLVDEAGAVVGINTAILSVTGYYQGYGFAVPSDLARHVVSDLMKDGRVHRAWLGLTMTGVTAEDAEVFGLPGVAGAVVQSVAPDSPAEDGGLREGDVIVAVDRAPLRQSGSLQEMIAERDPGDRVALDIYRDKEHRTVTLQLGEMPLREGAAAPHAARDERSSGETRLGLRAAALTPVLARQYGFDPSTQGLVVTQVDPLGPSGEKGVAPGLRLLEVDGHAVGSSRELDEAMRAVSPGKAITLRLIDRAGQRRLVNVRVD